MDSSLIILPPPDASGTPYDHQTRLVPLGTGEGGVPPPPVTENLYKLFNDDVDTLQEVQSATNDLNVNLQLGGTLQAAEAQLRDQLATLEPSNPQVPIIMKYVECLDELMKGGTVPGLQIGINLNPDGSVQYIQMSTDHVEDSESVKAARALVDTSAVGEVKTNRWLQGNAFIAFLVAFMELMRLFMQNKMIQTQVETAAMALMKEMGQTMHDLTEASGRKQAKMDQQAGISAAISAGATGVCTCVSAVGMYRSSAQPEVDTPTTYNGAEAPPNLNDYSAPVGNPAEVPAPDYISVKQPNGEWQTVKNNYNYRTAEGDALLNTPPDADQTLGMIGSRDPPGTIRPANTPGRQPPAVTEHQTTNYKQMPVEESPGGKSVTYTKPRSQIVKENEGRAREYQAYVTMPKMVSETISQATQAWQQLSKAHLEMEKTEKDALLQIFNVASRIIEKMMGGGAEAVKLNSDLAGQTLQTLESMEQKRTSAIQAAYTRTK